MNRNNTGNTSKPVPPSSNTTDISDTVLPDNFFNGLNLLPGNAMIIDTNGMIQYINPFGLKLSGYQKAEIVGHPLDMFWDQPQKTTTEILSHLKQRLSWQGEIKHRHKNGSSYWEMVSLSVVPCKDSPATVIVKIGLYHPPEKQAKIGRLKENYNKLEKKAALYRTMFDASPDPICLTRLEDGKYIYANKAFYERTGFTPEQTSKYTAVELGVYSGPEERNRLIKRLKRNGQVENLEMKIRTQNGTLTNDLWSMRVIEYEGEPHLFVISRDHSQLRSAQQALMESEESYRGILKSAPYSIVVTRISDAKYLQVNDAFCRRTGYSRDEALGHTPYELGIFVDPSIRELLFKILKRDGRVDNLEIQFRAKDGTILDNLLSAIPITYKGEACLLTSTVAISELKAAQRALKESEERYRNILKNMEEGYWEMDLKGRFSFVNEAECRIHKRTKKEMIGKRSREFASLETGAEISNLFKRVYESGIPALMYEVEIIRSDGTIAIIESSSSLLRDSNGKPIGFFGISRDISEKREAEKELEQYRLNLEKMVQKRTKDLEEAQEELVKREKLSVLGQLTATVSHELRNPLGVIQSSNFYLQRKIGPKTDKISKHFKRIDDQVALCDSIVADLLEYTRRRKLILRTTSLQTWLEELIREIEDTQSTAIKSHFHGALPPTPHDQEKMRRVFINLIENAIHATRDREESEKKAGKNYQPKISIEAHDESGQLVLKVRDNGEGMNKDTLARAFEPLFTTRARGTGIGLANVHRIVNDHGGAVSLKSTPGQGTTVTLSLPYPDD